MTLPIILNMNHLSAMLCPRQLDESVMATPAASPKIQANGRDSETTASAKRPSPDSDSGAAPPNAKRRKQESTSTERTREGSTSSTISRRANKKKSQEVADTTGQNAMASREVQAPDSKILDSLVLFENSNQRPGVLFITELQSGRCQLSRYKHDPFTRCVSCTRKGAGDTCRFQGIRYIIRDHKRRFLGTSLVEPTELTETSEMDFPSSWNRELDREPIQRSKLSIAKALLPTLIMEQKHTGSTREIIRRQRETVVRVTCDTCMTSLFSTSFMCRRCGREICNECFQIVEELTNPESRAAVDGVELPAPRKKITNPSFLSCWKRDPHMFAEFTPVTRFAQSELNRAIDEMQGILDMAESTEITLPLREDPDDAAYPVAAGMGWDGNPALFPDPVTSPIYDDFTPPNTPSHVASIPIHRAQIIPASFYDPSSSNSARCRPVFSSVWEKGLPLLVKDLLPRFKLTWSPEYFINKYGDHTCTIVECQTEVTQSLCVREYFEWFGKYENRSKCWKLKDWPPTADFKNAFPELFDDFSNAVPVPDYVRRDGVYNIASHFPSNALKPDLGPKMYNSMASSQEAGSQGSTRLHMDMADAFNVMLYASNCADGSPGYAVWDLFHAEDSDKIRDFLRKKFNRSTATTKGQQQEAQLPIQAIADHDPIHIQQFYLDVELRRQLWEEYGVKSFRIYQRPGEGVFIPAGCAHQVANIADCIKIAIDFVSPENIDRCEKLTKEFREQNQRKTWKEDVLQLRTMMWFAWQSCAKKEMELSGDSQDFDRPLVNGKLENSNNSDPEPLLDVPLSEIVNNVEDSLPTLDEHPGSPLSLVVQNDRSIEDCIDE